LTCLSALSRISFRSQVFDELSPNHGAGGGSKTNQSAIGIYWTTAFPGRGGRALSRLPGLPNDFTTDLLTINTLGFAEIGHQAGLFLNAVNATPSPLGGNLALVTLHRSAGGAPLAASQSRPIDNAQPVPIVCTLRRRSSKRR